MSKKTLFMALLILGAWIVLLTSLTANAQTVCIEDQGTPTLLPSSLADPQQFVTDCKCYSWAAPSGTVDHYHFYANGVNMGNPRTRAIEVCMPTKNTVYKLDVEAVRPTDGTPVGVLSNPLYVKWVDRDTSEKCSEWEPAQCVNIHDRVVPCP